MRILLLLLLPLGLLAARPTPTVTAWTTSATLVAEVRQPWFEATVVRVVDGDTLEVAIKLLPGHVYTGRVRLMGVDTAETHSNDGDKRKKGNAGKAFTEKAVAEVKNKIWVSPVKMDVFGRLLSYVRLGDSGPDLGEALVGAGLAIRGYDKSRN